MKQPLQQLLKKSDGTLVELPGLAPSGDGQLAETAPPGQAPTTPMGAAQAGVTPDAAKMAGTPAQASGPVVLRREAPAPAPSEGGGQPGSTPPGAAPAGQKLADVLRTQNNTAHQLGQGPQVDAEEVRRQQDAQRRIATFGNLGSRIHNLIESGGYLTPRTDGAGSDDNPLQLSPLADDVSPEARDSIEAMLAGGSTPELVAAAKQALGGEDPFKYVNRNVGAQTASAVTSVTPDQLMLDYETVNQLGYAPADLAGILGVPEAQLGQISLQQMQQMLQDNIATEQTSAAAAQQRAIDPAAGPNERAQARAELRRLGATGVYATEQQMQQLAQEIDSATEVEFNGRVMKIEDILSDENMTALVDEYVSSSKDSQFRKDLQKNEPALAAFLERHEAGLREALVNLDDSAQKFEELQQGGVAALNSLKTAGLDEGTANTMMKELLGEAWKPGYMTTAVDMSQFPTLAALSDPATQQKMGMDPGVTTQQFAELARVSPGAAALLAKLDPAAAAKSGLGKRDSKEWGAYLQYVKDWEQAKTLDWSDTAAVSSFLFGGRTLDQVQGQLSAELGRAALGESSAWLKQMRPLLDKDSDGRIDSPDVLKESVTSHLGGGGVDAVKSLEGFRSAPASGPRTLASVLGGAAADGRVDASEIQIGELPRDIPPSEILRFAENPAVTPDARAKLVDYAGNKELESQLTSAGFQWKQILDMASAGHVPDASQYIKLKQLEQSLTAYPTPTGSMKQTIDALRRMLGSADARGAASAQAATAQKAAADRASQEKIYANLVAAEQRRTLTADEQAQLEAVAKSLGKPTYRRN